VDIVNLNIKLWFVSPSNKPGQGSMWPFCIAAYSCTLEIKDLVKSSMHGL
jgi:hypothetical protein